MGIVEILVCYSRCIELLMAYCFRPLKAKSHGKVITSNIFVAMEVYVFFISIRSIALGSASTATLGISLFRYDSDCFSSILFMCGEAKRQIFSYKKPNIMKINGSLVYYFLSPSPLSLSYMYIYVEESQSLTFYSRS